MIGTVIKKTALNFTIFDKEKKEEVIAFPRKKIKSEINIMVGDVVNYNLIDNSFVIENVLERKNYIKRPSVANIDYLAIVYSVKKPDFNSFLLNKFIAFYESFNIDKVIIIFTKMDLLTQKELKDFNEIFKAYKKDKYICLNSNDKKDIEFFKSLFEDEIVCCLAGQSGVGKSTLINKIIPNSQIATQEISKSLNRGKHTTTTASLVKFNNGFFIDTPGFSSIEFDFSAEDLARSYNDFRMYASECKFSNCLHDSNSVGCNVIKKVNENKIYKQRYLDYLKMLDQIQSKNKNNFLNYKKKK
ncbi:ribosome small subunit-dependent GTPase A [Malacoplasma iowae]|uniref:ribosome small subunit-dependent GTPase A n=1 Tax=Malacoplasma iowae TaxID=2116 RepID=UPI002A18DF4C|nr:ribosome small subunit-dependent GTPase A [Malacoplasma iowae]WPL39729.1 ribosome small subunit-dependent GTPase A [Malacoplasma iowae]